MDLVSRMYSPLASNANVSMFYKVTRVDFFCKDVVDLNQDLRCCHLFKKSYYLRHAPSGYSRQSLSCRWLELNKQQPYSYRNRKMVHIIPLASTDDGVAVNGSLKASSSSEMEDVKVKLDQSLNEDVRIGLVQAVHDAVRAIELAILEHSSSSKTPWFSKAWLGIDNAWLKTLAYQAAIYSLLQAALEISSRGDGHDRDINNFVQRSLSRQCAPLEGAIQDKLSSKQSGAYGWFWSEQLPIVIASFVNTFEKEPRFSAAITLYDGCLNGQASNSGMASDLSLLMLALSCLAAITKLGSAKVSCSQFFSLIPDTTGRLMDMLLEFVPVKKAYSSMTDIGLRREFLFHFGPRAASCKLKIEHGGEEVAFWIDLVQKQLQRAIDRERIWSRLTTSESIEVLEKDLAIFGFFIALGRGTQSFLSSKGYTVADHPLESIIRYLIGGSVLYYPQLSSISSYQLYVEVVCEELEWLPFYQINSENAKETHENDSRSELPNHETICEILDVCSFWMTSFIKYSKWLWNPSNFKAARFLSKGHDKLIECQKSLGMPKDVKKEVGEQRSRKANDIYSATSNLDSFDKALENVEEALNRLEDLLQELHLSNSNSEKEHLKAACSDLERIRKLKKEAEFLEASFREKAESMEELSFGGEIRASETQQIDKERSEGFWSFLVRNSTTRTGPQVTPPEENVTASEMHVDDADSNGLRRFELLRRELMEIQRRVQKSTGDTQETEVAGLDDGDDDASGEGHIILVKAEQQSNVLAKSINEIKKTSTDVLQGTQLLAIDVAAASVLLKRSLTGDELTGKEKKALQRTLTDMASVLPIGFLMLLPVTAVGHAAMLAAIQRYMPSLIPSTYAPERLDLLRQLEKVKEMESTEIVSDESTEEVSSISSSENL